MYAGYFLKDKTVSYDADRKGNRQKEISEMHVTIFNIKKGNGSFAVHSSHGENEERHIKSPILVCFPFKRHGVVEE